MLCYINKFALQVLRKLHHSELSRIPEGPPGTRPEAQLFVVILIPSSAENEEVHF